MKCFYINLDSAVERRDSIEANFKANQKEGWVLERVSAIDVNCINDNRIQGRLTQAEKACFLSHKKIIQGHLETAEPLFILEDDAVFGQNTCTAIEEFIKAEKKSDWDIVFTDVCVTTIGQMAALFKIKHQLAAQKKITILNLRSLRFAGATAYILNPKSIKKIWSLLNMGNELNIPYDLFLRKLINENKIKGFVFFPFCTSLSEFSDSSQTQPLKTAMTELVWNLYRKLIWRDARLAQYKLAIEKIERSLSDEARAFGVLWAAMADKKFKNK